MKNEMTREKLRGLIDPELIGELKRKPIEPAKIGNYIYHRELMWKMLILQTVLPLCKGQIRLLTEYADLLTDEERDLVEQYKLNLVEFEENWREMPFAFPTQPKNFDKILLD